MKRATLEFLRQRFGAYYQEDRLSLPPTVAQREWAVVLFDPDYPEIHMHRHMGFPGKEEVLAYIRNMAPAHLYYSSAYYALPHAPTMPEKGWLGADLIFDLDADHITRGPYEMMLERVRQETEKLIGMLTGELGFPAAGIELVFSGGRGYHVHVRDMEIRGWGSEERREVIDYVCGIGIDPGIILSLPAPSPRGWHQRYIAALNEYLLWLESMEQKQAVAELMSLEGVGKGTAEEFLKRIPGIGSALAKDASAINLKDFATGKVIRGLAGSKEGRFLALLREKAALADEPVTTDIKRLIRMPTSLHGGSGFRVTPVPLRELPSFDPLQDAVVFGTRPVTIDCSRNLSMTLLGEVHDVPKGTSQVPEALAVFLCCRGMAEIGGAHAA
jgi:DNA primase small subunit